MRAGVLGMCLRATLDFTRCGRDGAHGCRDGTFGRTQFVRLGSEIWLGRGRACVACKLRSYTLMATQGLVLLPRCAPKALPGCDTDLEESALSFA